ncbi:MAG: energy transducer TonB [Bacteroidota bacterium]
MLYRLVAFFALLGSSAHLMLGCQTTRLGNRSPCEASAATEVFEATDTPGFDPPKLIIGNPPLLERMHYPEKLRRNGIGGEVVVSFIVTPSGCVTAAEVTTSAHREMDREAQRLIKTARFTPATLNGEPVPARQSLSLTWNVQVN